MHHYLTRRLCLFTIVTAESVLALAGVPVNFIDTLTAIQAGVGCAVVDVIFAVRATITRLTLTDVASAIVICLARSVVFAGVVSTCTLLAAYTHFLRADGFGFRAPLIATGGRFRALITGRALRPGTRFRGVFRVSKGQGAPVQALGLLHILYRMTRADRGA